MSYSTELLDPPTQRAPLQDDITKRDALAPFVSKNSYYLLERLQLLYKRVLTNGIACVYGELSRSTCPGQLWAIRYNC